VLLLSVSSSKGFVGKWVDIEIFLSRLFSVISELDGMKNKINMG